MSYFWIRNSIWMWTNTLQKLKLPSQLANYVQIYLQSLTLDATVRNLIFYNSGVKVKEGKYKTDLILFLFFLF